MLVGIDDTDSLNGMCTTYLAALLVEKLKVTGFPRLIRLNPNIPYRTRGNGAIALNVEGSPEKTKKIVLEMVEKYARMEDENTNPGVVFIRGLNQERSKLLGEFYGRAVSELVKIEDAEKLAAQVDAEVHKFKNGRGIIGALAAAGATLPERTYEIIAYRAEKNYGTERRIDAGSIFRMDDVTYPQTFNNVDPETGQVMIIPHGYDPILCGIRGRSPQIVERAWKMLSVGEEVERTLVFETNQGTDAHLREKKVSELKPYDCAIISGEVNMPPQTIEGGHVIFGFSDGTGKIACAAYEPTGGFRDVVRKLVVGDQLIVYGSIGSYPSTLNLEKVNITKLIKIEEKTPPVCCGKRMTSAGTEKGFKCKKCGKKAGEDAATSQEAPRGLAVGFHEVPVRAKRHLNKPLILYDAEPTQSKFNSLKSKVINVMRRGSTERKP
jgi:tRNA(Ile2)-agmatinylcytidine synthase